MTHSANSYFRLRESFRQKRVLSQQSQCVRVQLWVRVRQLLPVPSTDRAVLGTGTEGPPAQTEPLTENCGALNKGKTLFLQGSGSPAGPTLQSQSDCFSETQPTATVRRVVVL